MGRNVIRFILYIIFNLLWENKECTEFDEQSELNDGWQLQFFPEINMIYTNNKHRSSNMCGTKQK